MLTIHIDWENSVAYFSWIVTSGGNAGRETAIGNKLLNGEIWSSNGETFDLVYKRESPERTVNVYGIFGEKNNLISRSHNAIGEVIDISDVWD